MATQEMILIDRNKKDYEVNEMLDKIKEVNNLPLYKKGRGLCIGNMSSQMIATLYLDELDKYIKYNLNIRFTRFMDDIICISEDKEYLKYCLGEIEKIVNKYRLVLNKKTKIYSSSEEIFVKQIISIST